MFTEVLNKRILIVGDDPSMRDQLRRALLRAGYEVAIASTAEEAMESILGGHGGGEIQAVISDVFLPGMDGHTLVDRIRDRQPEIKAVLTTSFGSAVDYLETTRTGSVEYLLKPLDFPRLLNILETSIGRPEEMPSDYWVS